MDVKVTFKLNGTIKTETYFMGYEISKKQAIADALKYATGYGDEDYYEFDNPEVLSREIISIEILEEPTQYILVGVKKENGISKYTTVLDTCTNMERLMHIAEGTRFESYKNDGYTLHVCKLF